MKPRRRLVISMFSIATCASVACGGTRAEPVATAAPAYEVRDATPESLGGWTKLGERSLDADGTHDSVRSGIDAGRFSSVRFVLEHGKVEIANVVLTFGDGTTLTIPSRLTFGKGTLSRAIDLPGDARVIRAVEFKYSAVTPGRAAQIEVWAR